MRGGGCRCRQGGHPESDADHSVRVLSPLLREMRNPRMALGITWQLFVLTTLKTTPLCCTSEVPRVASMRTRWLMLLSVSRTWPALLARLLTRAQTSNCSSKLPARGAIAPAYGE